MVVVFCIVPGEVYRLDRIDVDFRDRLRRAPGRLWSLKDSSDARGKPEAFNAWSRRRRACFLYMLEWNCLKYQCNVMHAPTIIIRPQESGIALRQARRRGGRHGRSKLLLLLLAYECRA